MIRKNIKLKKFSALTLINTVFIFLCTAGHSLDTPSNILEKTSEEPSFSKEWVAFSTIGHSTSIAKVDHHFAIVASGQLKEGEPRGVLLVEKTNETGWQPPTILYSPQEFSSAPDAFCTSPVLCKVYPTDPESKEYFLFFRVGTSYQTKDLQSVFLRSTDHCQTFVREQLPEGFIGPTKCKPLYFGPYLVFGSSIEIGETGNKNRDGHSSTFVQIEVYDTRTSLWYRSPRIAGESAFGAIEPTFYALSDSGLQTIRILCRNRNGGYAQTAEFTLPNDPQTIDWPIKLISSPLPNCDSGLDIVDLSEKTINGRTFSLGSLIAFGNFLGSRNSLEMMISSDAGKTWSDPIVVDSYSGEFPSCYFEEGTGKIHMSYCSYKPDLPRTKVNQTIRYIEMDPVKIFDGASLSRD